LGENDLRERGNGQVYDPGGELHLTNGSGFRETQGGSVFYCAGIFQTKGKNAGG